MKNAGGARLEREPEDMRAELEELRRQHATLQNTEEELREQLEDLGDAQVRIQEQRAAWDQLFENTPEAQLVTSLSGLIANANAAAIEVLQVPARFIVGKPLAVYMADERAFNVLLGRVADADSAKGPLVIQARGGESTEMDVRVRADRTNARLVWTLHVSEGPPSSREEVARAMRETELVVARERDLRAQLVRESEEKDHFLSVLSHDLRAPLNAILGWTQLLQGNVLDPAAQPRALDTIERNARAQSKLIEELLDMSRIGAKRMPIALVPIDLGRVAARVVEGATPIANESGIRFHLDVEPGLVVLGDGQRLTQILTNLVGNALKFSARGGQIDVLGGVTDGDVWLTVRDFGRGIPPVLLPHVFDLYAQNQGDRAARKGLGLGLYIVSQLVTLQNGSVVATSEGEGKGASFTLQFPLHGEPALPSTNELET